MTMLFSIVLATMSLIGAVADGTDIHGAQTALASVEIGLAELSPRGAEGGFAVPASGESISATCIDTTTAQATITVPNDPNYAHLSSGALYVDGVYVGTISIPGSKTVNVAHNSYHTGTVRSGGGWYGGINGDYVPLTEHHFNFTTQNCGAAPTVSCSVSPTSADVGETVTWSANASGGNGTYTYQWQGTNSLSGTSASVNKSYSTAGTKTGQVRATSGGITSAWTNCSNSVSVTEPAEDPTVTLQVRNATRYPVGHPSYPNWTQSNITIYSGDQISLKWDSANADSCSGTNFSTGSGSPADGVQSTVSEPTVNSYKTYTVVCTGEGGTASDTIRVDADPAPVVGGPPTIEGDPLYVRIGDDTTISWDTNGNAPASCSIEGPGLDLAALSSEVGSDDVTINGESTYTIVCPAGSDSVTIEVLPIVQET